MTFIQLNPMYVRELVLILTRSESLNHAEILCTNANIAQPNVRSANCVNIDMDLKLDLR